MSKAIFISEIKELLADNPELLSKEAKAYFFDILDTSGKAKDSKLSENGKLIMEYMQTEPNKCLTSKDLGDAIGKSSRSASGSMRKLVELGLVEKVGKDPVVYQITADGLAYKL